MYVSLFCLLRGSTSDIQAAGSILHGQFWFLTTIIQQKGSSENSLIPVLGQEEYRMNRKINK